MNLPGKRKSHKKETETDNDHIIRKETLINLLIDSNNPSIKVVILYDCFYKMLSFFYA